MKRVLVICSERILSAGIESLLAHERDFSVFTIAPADVTAITEEIAHFQPNVVIWDENRPFSELTTVLNLARDYPELRVLVVNLHDNRVHVYAKQEFLLNQGTDLVEAVRLSPSIP